MSFIKRIILFLPVIFALSHGIAAAELKIAATILPVSDMVQEIVGDEANVITILPPRANPHTFELTPQLVKELDGSTIIFRIGKNFDDWIAGISENLPNVQIMPLDREFEMIGGDPHYWLSIKNAKIMVGHITDALVRADPSNEEKYRNNLNRYRKILERTDQSIKSKLANLSRNEMITFHDGWRYFARDYGLEVVGTIESSEGSEPTPKRLAQLGQTIKQRKIRVLFTETGNSESMAQSMVQDFGLATISLDPLGIREENKKFTDLMLYNTGQIAKGLTIHGSADH